MSSELSLPSKLTDEERAEIARREREEIALSVDAATKARAGSLAAHGCLEQAIADILLISFEQSEAIKDSAEYRTKYAEVADEIIQRQIDTGDGWDAVEQGAIKQILQTLEFNRDPKFALFAATAANKATRRKPDQQKPRVLAVPGGPTLDTENAEVVPTIVNNVINLTINRNFLNTKLAGENAATIDVTPKSVPLQRKVADLPTPASVENLLSPVRAQKKNVVSEIEQQFINAGVVFDSDDGT